MRPCNLKLYKSYVYVYDKMWYGKNIYDQNAAQFTNNDQFAYVMNFLSADNWYDSWSQIYVVHTMTYNRRKKGEVIVNG